MVSSMASKSVLPTTNLNTNSTPTTIPTPTRKFNRWDTWTSAKVIISESNGTGDNKTEFNLQSFNIRLDRHTDKTKTLGFALGLGTKDRTTTGADFNGDVNTTQWTLSSYTSLKLNKHNTIEAILSLAQGKHKVSPTTTSNDQNSNSYFTSITYRGNMQKGKFNLSPYARYGISHIKRPLYKYE